MTAALQNLTTARQQGVVVCRLCGRPDEQGAARCRRCRARLTARKTASISRSWALLIAAYVLYIPANLLPVMETRSLLGVQEDTIISGVVYLWASGSQVLALVVFVASVAVPLLKMISLTILLLGLRSGAAGDPLERTRLYRLLEAIGRWSMLDVFVVALLVALVQAQSLASVAPGTGTLAFAAVVVLSMLATMAFDPRLIWDAAERRQGHP